VEVDVRRDDRAIDGLGEAMVDMVECWTVNYWMGGVGVLL